MMQIESVKAAYRRYAAVYDAVFGPVLQPGRKAVVQALRLRPGERVLEVGVGTGLSLQLYPRDVAITGIDVSREMLEKARRRVARRARLLEDLHRVCRPDGEIFLVNHVRSDNRFVAAVEKGLARFSDKLGFRPDFELRDMVSGAEQLTELSRINFFWKVMRLKNGIAHRLGNGSEIR